MRKDIKTIAIVPARGGSKGLSRKNICLLNGKPLIAYSIIAGLNAKSIDALYVSTNDDEIAEVSIEFGAKVIRRPENLATDIAQNNAVICHALDTLQAQGYDPKTVVLLQPTSPFRNASHIDECIQAFVEHDAVSSWSVCPVDHHPGKAVVLRGLLVEPFTNAADMEARRQNMTTVFRQNGAIYVVSVDAFMREKSLYNKPCLAYVMDRKDSIDIDDAFDLQFAEFMAFYKSGMGT